MRAIVLVGGEGTRLRPLTWRTPKALVPVLGRPLLEHLLLDLRSHDVDHVTLAMTHRNKAIRDAFGNGDQLGVRLDYAYEDTPLGSGGAIASIARGWQDEGWNETFLVRNGDVITDLDISAMVEEHRRHRAVLSISLHEVEDPSPYGVVDIDEDGRIHRFVEKPSAGKAPSRLINAGTWIFEPGLVDRLDPEHFNRVEDTLFPRLCEDGEPIFGFHRDAYWMDVGNSDALLRVNLDMASGRTASAASKPTAEGVYVAPGAVIEKDATVDPPAVIGAGCVIRSGARVAGSLLWDDVTVEAGASIADSILATGVHVGVEASIDGSVVAHHNTIQPGASLSGQRVEPADHGTVDASASSGTP